MAQIHINQITKFINNVYGDKIDFSDVNNFDKNSEQGKSMFISRALNAFAIQSMTGCDVEEAARSVTDGSKDNGIDAIYFDEQDACLYLTQAKYIKDGKSEPGAGEIEIFLRGVRNLIDFNFESFNEKIKARYSEIEEYFENYPDIKVKILLVYTGVNECEDGKRRFDEFVAEMNDVDQWISYEYVNQKDLYKFLFLNNNEKINLDTFMIRDFGVTDVVAKSYYGRVAASDLGELWKMYGPKLFSENIRSLLPKSDVNTEMLDTLKKRGKLFWYYNNGVTVICDSIQKNRIGGNDRKVGIFSIKGASIVNGAQTVGTIGKYYLSLDEDKREDKLADIDVQVRFIQIKNDDGSDVLDDDVNFGRDITINNNMQNRIIARDFASQTEIQKILRKQLEMEGITYHITRSESTIKDENNFTIDEAARARCNSMSIKYSMFAHRGINSHLFRNVESDDYKAVFNESLDGYELWNCVRIQRGIDSIIKNLRKNYSEYKDILIYGKDLLSFIVFRNIYNRMGFKNRIVELKNDEMEQCLLDAVRKIDIFVKSNETLKYKPIVLLFKNQSDVELVFNGYGQSNGVTAS